MTGKTLSPGVIKTMSGNNNLKWEQTEQFNIGIDAAFLDNRLGVTMDYFQKENQRYAYPKALYCCYRGRRIQMV